SVKLWDVVSKTRIGTLPDHSNEVVSVGFSLDGQILGVGSEDNGVKLWDVRTRKIIATFEGNSARIAFSPVGTLLTIGSGGNIYGDSGGVVNVWDYRTGERVLSLPESGGRATFSPDG